MMCAFSLTGVSAFEAIFSPYFPLEDLPSLPDAFLADSSKWKLYIDLVASDGGGILFVER
jgi:hypothetical protein